MKPCILPGKNHLRLAATIALILTAQSAVAGDKNPKSPEPQPSEIPPQMIGDMLPVYIVPSTLTGFVEPKYLAAFKIADNESPRPQNRVFLTYNYYNNVTPNLAGNLDLGRVDIHSEVIGFEKTFLDGNASIGLRVPIFTVNAGDGPDRLVTTT